MTKVEVKTPGLVIDIHGMKPVRTPAVFLAPDNMIPLVEAYLSKNGNVDYRIVREDGAKTTEENPPNTKVLRGAQVVDPILSRLDAIDEVLRIILKNTPFLENVEPAKKRPGRPSKKNKETVVEDFIPSLDTTLESKFFSSRSQKLSDISQQVEELKKLQKTKKEEKSHD